MFSNLAQAAARRVMSSRAAWKAATPTTKAASLFGVAAAGAAVGVSAFSAAALAEKPPSMLSGSEFTSLKLLDAIPYNHNTTQFFFALPCKHAPLDLPVASMLVVKSDDCVDEKGVPVVRPYTPINQSIRGQLCLLVKDYPEGKMSSHMFNMKIGDTLDFKGPWMKTKYEANKFKELGMIAGGTGVTPMLQVLEEILKNKDDNTKVSLLFANEEERDILCRARLDTLAARHPNFTVNYVVSKPASDWSGETGYVNKDMVDKYMPKPSQDSMVYFCGPPGMEKAIVGPKTKDRKQGDVAGVMKAAGFSSDNVFKF